MPHSNSFSSTQVGLHILQNMILSPEASIKQGPMPDRDTLARVMGKSHSPEPSICYGLSCNQNTQQVQLRHTTQGHIREGFNPILLCKRGFIELSKCSLMQYRSQHKFTSRQQHNSTCMLASKQQLKMLTCSIKASQQTSAREKRPLLVVVIIQTSCSQHFCFQQSKKRRQTSHPKVGWYAETDDPTHPEIMKRFITYIRNSWRKQGSINSFH